MDRTLVGVCLGVLVHTGCGDNLLRCEAQDILASPPYCVAAATFAARATTELVPTQAELDLYYARWSRVVEAEPVLDRVPQRYRARGSLDIMTRNASVIEAWTKRVLRTGDESFDATIAVLRPTSLNSFWTHNDDESYTFLLESPVMYSQEVLQARLAPLDSWLNDPLRFPGDDGTWAWIDEGVDTEPTAEILFRIGWGDCFTACAGYRMLKAVAPAAEAGTMVYDLGGDPLPPHLALRPTTKPPPSN